ncbi:DUF4389 domain-containing protein [Streptacidiphilus sp. PB12-B1b]|uniref:DUF4389 domain-containing protein n=1 Tax=Streptacidiphilus sp. PB12-B1b TaxID=2705012 RepID=UPI0015F86CF8|nr:DUF4389 domain-containing protein [Streptacidiphilus sp. PB12-B1b]QMU77107.1 DUF4389 domain-containing protein [Streptacidiphilus sp. PB12-B1b]
MAEQTWAAPPAPALPDETLPELDVPEPGRQRRWTVLLRWLLLVPQFVVLFVLGIAAVVVTVVGWFSALVLGRLPEPVAGFLLRYLAYQTRVHGYAMLLVDRYPPFAFDAPEYPIRIEVRPGRLNRLAVLFRIILMIPAAIVAGLLTSGYYAVSIIIWLVALVLGRLPVPVFQATAAVTRYTMRLSAYVSMLSSAYPKRLFGDQPGPAQQPRSATRPLTTSGGAKGLLVLFLVAGLVSGGFSGSGSNSDSGTMAQPGSSTAR